jgi:MFS family permease
MPYAPAVPAAGPAPLEVQAGARGTYIAFIGSGFAFASWASRIPQVRDHLHFSPARLGLVLLAIAAGSVIALPLAGPVVHRFGSRCTITVLAALLSAGMAIVACGYFGGLVPLVAGLFLLGFAYGAWEVAANVQAAVVEHHLGRSIMSRFHAGYSLGTVMGALIGALMVALRVPVPVHLLAVAVVTCVAVCWGARWFIPDIAADGPHEESGRRSALAAWREPRTVLIGIFVLAFAFAEGTGNDWISIATIGGYRTPAAIGTLAFALFLTAMTAGRWLGPGLLDRYGRVPVVRVLAAVAVAGALLFVFAPAVPLAFVGVTLWGAGTSLGFPVGMSAGADDPRHTAGRVSVIASIGYCAFLAGPPTVGFLGDHLTVLRALTAVPVLLAIAALIGAAVAQPRRAGD